MADVDELKYDSSLTPKDDKGRWIGGSVLSKSPDTATDKYNRQIVALYRNSDYPLYCTKQERGIYTYYYITGGEVVNDTIQDRAPIGDFSTQRSYFSTDSGEFDSRDKAVTRVNVGLKSGYNILKDSDITEFKTTIPMFSSTDTDSIKAYLINGDTSGALNKKDIDPVSSLFTVTIDGDKNPHIFIDLTNNGDRPVNGYVKFYNLFTTASFSDILPHDMSINYTWYKLKEKLGLPLFGAQTPLSLGLVMVADDGDGEDASMVSMEVSADSSYSTVRNPSTNGLVELVVVQGEHKSDDDENDYPSDDDENNAEDTNNDYDGECALTKTYFMTQSHMQDLGGFLWGANFMDNIKLLNNSPIENVLAIKAMPLTSSGNTEGIKLGNVDTGINAPVVNHPDNIKVHVGNITISSTFDNFLDYTATTITVYLPYIGFKELDTSQVLNSDLSIDYIFNAVLGTCMAVIKRGKSIMTCFEGQCGIDVPLTSTNRNQLESSLLVNAIGGVTSLATGNVMGAMWSGINMANMQFHSQTSGIGNASLLAKMPNNVFFIVNRPKKFKPNGYGKHYGYICNMYKRIDSLSGFTIIKNFPTSGIPQATANEKEMLRTLFASGVYL